jgi:hypothetical protein
MVTKNWFGVSPPVTAEPIQLQTGPPAGVTGAVATLMLNGRVRLVWNRDPAAENYQIKKSVNGGAFSQLVVVPSDQIEYEDGSLMRRSALAYQIISTNRYGASAPVVFEQESVDREPIPPKTP